MSREICNPQHLGQITHIDTITNTLVCSNDIPQFQASGANLMPIQEYANESAELIRSINNDTHILLSKLESAKTIINTTTMKERIDTSFAKYIDYVNSVKERLLLRLSRTSLNSNPALANEFCSFAEQTSMANINLRKAILNNDFMEIRKHSVRTNIYQMKERYNFYEQNLFKTNFSPSAGFEVMFKEPNPDPDLILTQIGISLIGYQATTLKQQMNPSSPRPLNAPQASFLNSPPEVKSQSFMQSPPRNESLIQSQPQQSNFPKIDPKSTLHFFDKMTKKFLFFSIPQQKVFTLAVPLPLTSFPYDGFFPSKYYNNQLFFCGGQSETQLIKATFIINLSSGSIEKKSDMNYERAFHCLEEVDGKMVAIGGKTTKTETGSCEIFTPSNLKPLGSSINQSEWQMIPQLQSARSNAVSFTFNSCICYVIGGLSSTEENLQIETCNFRDKDMKWSYIKFHNPANFQIPERCSNSCDLGSGKFLIFGGFTQKSMLTSCIFNANQNVFEKEIPLSNRYYTHDNKSPCFFKDNEVSAIDDTQKIHFINILSGVCTIFDGQKLEKVQF